MFTQLRYLQPGDVFLWGGILCTLVKKSFIYVSNGKPLYAITYKDNENDNEIFRVLVGTTKVKIERMLIY